MLPTPMTMPLPCQAQGLPIFRLHYTMERLAIEAALQVPPPSYEEAISHPSTWVYQTEDPSAAPEQPKDEHIPNNRSHESGQGTNES
ncbi:unnamed protein product [Lampetra fluviatilis]